MFIVRVWVWIVRFRVKLYYNYEVNFKNYLFLKELRWNEFFLCVIYILCIGYDLKIFGKFVD